MSIVTYIKGTYPASECSEDPPKAESYNLKYPEYSLTTSPKNTKYKFTGEYMSHNGYILFRIQAIKSFGDNDSKDFVKAGDLGGWIGSESNLCYDEPSWNHHAKCWVYDEGKVYGKAIIEGSGKVKEFADVSDNARVSDNAMVKGNTKLTNRASISQKATITGDTTITDDAHVFMDATVNGNGIAEGTLIRSKVWIGGDSSISGDAEILGGTIRSTQGNTTIDGNALVAGNPIITNSVIRGDCRILDTAIVVNSVLGYNTRVQNNAEVYDINIYGEYDFIRFTQKPVIVATSNGPIRYYALDYIASIYSRCNPMHEWWDNYRELLLKIPNSYARKSCTPVYTEAQILEYGKILRQLPACVGGGKWGRPHRRVGNTIYVG